MEGECTHKPDFESRMELSECSAVTTKYASGSTTSVAKASRSPNCKTGITIPARRALTEIRSMRLALSGFGGGPL